MFKTVSFSRRHFSTIQIERITFIWVSKIEETLKLKIKLSSLSMGLTKILSFPSHFCPFIFSGRDVTWGAYQLSELVGWLVRKWNTSVLSNFESCSWP